MSLFPRPRKRRLRRRSRGSRTLWFTAMRVSGMLSRGITEHTTTPLRLILPTAAQANSWYSNLDDRRDFWRWVSVVEANAKSCHLGMRQRYHYSASHVCRWLRTAHFGTISPMNVFHARLKR